MKLISCKNLTLGYTGKEVLKNVSFDINSGDFVCILGENGSGKTTLMKTLLGIIKPIGGEIIFPEGKKSMKIGYLPQIQDFQKDFPATVEEIVLSGFTAKVGFRFFYNAEEKSIAADNMKKMNVCEMAKKPYAKLSGGQKRRVLIARALCAADELLLLDEPAAGLDPASQNELYDIIEKLNKKEKMTIIMISHDIPVSERLATKILHVGNDVVLSCDKTADNGMEQD